MEIKDKISAVVEEISKRPLPNNPNQTIGGVFTPKELIQFAIYGDQTGTLRRELLEAAGPEDKQNILDGLEEFEKRKDDIYSFYNRPPITYSDEEFFPDYFEKKRRYDEGEAARQARRALDPSYDPSILALPTRSDREPMKPFGYDEVPGLAALGFDARNELTFEDFSKGAQFRSLIPFLPRNTTTRDYETLAKKVGLDGDFRLSDPSNPSSRMLFRPSGSDEIKIVNSPYFTAEDTYNLILQEFPALAGDIALTVYGARKFTPQGLLSGTFTKKAKQVLGISGLSGVGATGGDLVRLLAGSALGAHDRDIMDMIEESGIIGAMAFAGTGVVSTASYVIPKLVRMFLGKDVPAEFYKRIDDAYKAAENEGAALADAGILYGDEVSINRINKQIDYLTDKFKFSPKKKNPRFGEAGQPEFIDAEYDPTVAALAQTTDAADLELLFLKFADDPEVREMYQQIKLGNQAVIDEFVRVLAEKIGTPLADSKVTGEVLSKNLQLIGRQNIEEIQDNMYDVLDKVRMQLDGGDDPAKVGDVLFTQVGDPSISSPVIFQRQQTRLNEIRKDFVEPYNQQWTDTLAKYEGLTTGAGFTRAPTQNWMNLRKGEVDQLFRSSEADEAVNLLFEQIPGNSKNVLNRLRGRGEKGTFENPEFNINELNNARVSMNEFASKAANEGKNEISKVARELERGLERQMDQLIKEAAAEKSGIPITSTQKLDSWMRENDWGYDLQSAWQQQGEAIRLSQAEAVSSIVKRGRPEAVAEYIFGTSVKGSKQNTVITDLMTMLNESGSDEVLKIQKGLASYITKEILEAPDVKLLQKAKNFRNFVSDNEGTLRAAFGEEGFKKRFSSPRNFERNVINKLEDYEVDIQRLEARFGLANIIDPDNKVTNIVESILATGKTPKISGQVLDDIQYLKSITDDNPELADQVAQVTRRYLLNDIIQPRQGGGYRINEDALNNLTKGIFGPEQISGPALTLDNYLKPLLGKDGDDFVETLRVLNSMVQRELGAAPSESITKTLGAGEYGAGSNIEGARLFQRLIIAPLTITGRRINALTNKAAERSRKVIGKMLLDQELFNRTMAFAKGEENIQQLIRVLTAYGFVHTNDLANELQFYDSETKKLKIPDDPVKEKFPIGGTITEIPFRLIQLFNEDAKILDLFSDEKETTTK